MLFLLSPAKSLDFSPAPAPHPSSRPRLIDDAAVLARRARRLTRADLRRLMHLSDALADLNRTRFQALDPTDDDTGLQAAFAFNGDVYAGLRARTLDAGDLAWAQGRLRILSGLYGVLRPLDRIQPYRLEMGVRLNTRRGTNLYDFWGDRIARVLNDDLAGQAEPTVVNLASKEYFAAVDLKALRARVVSPRFLEERDGEARIVSFFAKKARGAMARWAVERRIERAEDLKGFDRDGYRFRPDVSSDEDWVFARAQP
ncbi:MAG TPA: peroxide stress protein YaaA [Caulobacteraceae bacterium]|nr:peroxide stress protein YaaA [Caulobacteraceae bacterium]